MARRGFTALLDASTVRLCVAGVLAAAPLALLAQSASAAGSAPVTHAISTTTNVDAATGNEPCLNGGPSTPTTDPTNCNIYTSKQDVWFSGLPNAAALGDGTYYFSVLTPGGQPDANDGAAKNLSDTTADPWSSGDLNSDASAVPSGDTYANRTFSLDGGTVAYAGSHGFFDNKIQLFPYDDTRNPGGVYILAVCKIDGANTYPAKASDCKYDAFRVTTGQPGQQASPLVVTKDAAGSYMTAYGWTIDKGVDKTLVKQVGGNATFGYTVQVGHDNGTTGDVHVTGTIDVFNPNFDSVTGATVTDQLSDGTDCAVTNGNDTAVATGDNFFAYACDLSGLPQGQLDNSVTVTWPDATLPDDGGLAAGTADFTFPDVAFAQSVVDNCVDVTDSFGRNGGTAATNGLGTVCVGGANPTTFSYQRTVVVPAADCVRMDNTATFTTGTTGATGSATKSVTVCGPAHTGALTMGFWQNSNGQTIIKTAPSAGGVCLATPWLRQYTQFQDLSSTANCGTVAGYAYKVVKAATCTSTSKTCNTMLKAQTLATALDVYFSDPTLGGNRISAPSPVGAVSIDLTKVCSVISSCAGSYVDVSSAFGGPTSLTVSQMLAYTASQSNVGGSAWYGQVKSLQVLAKDGFDAINNQVAFRP
jgi:hypothetical protein